MGVKVENSQDVHTYRPSANAFQRLSGRQLMTSHTFEILFIKAVFLTRVPQIPEIGHSFVLEIGL